MRLNVIHDITNSERRYYLEKEIQAQGLEVNYWLAIMAKVPKDGIMASHKKIVRHAKLNKWPETAIAEDDVKFTAPGAWEYFLENKPEDFDLYLSSIYAGDLQTDNTCSWFAGLSCYIISERFYDKFLSAPEGKHIDRALKNMGRFVVCNPFAAIQHETYSCNQRKILNNSKYLSGAKLYNG